MECDLELFEVNEVAQTARRRCRRQGCRLSERPLPPLPIASVIRTKCNSPIAEVTDPNAIPATCGVGCRLAILISRLGLRGNESCGCDEAAAEMDSLGPDGCRRERIRLVRALESNYAKLNLRLIDKAAIGARAVVMGVVINPADPAGSLLDAAIAQVEASV